MFSRVLALVDDAAAAPLLSGVRRLLGPHRGEVRVLAVLPHARAVTSAGRTIAFADQLDDASLLATRFVLDDHVARLRDQGLAASAEVRFGKPLTSVLDAARDWRAQVIALAEAPARGWRARLAPRLVDGILDRSPVPVVVTRAVPAPHTLTLAR